MFEIAQEFVQSLTWWQLYFMGWGSGFCFILFATRDLSDDWKIFLAKAVWSLLLWWCWPLFLLFTSEDIDGQITGFLSLVLYCLFALLIFSDIDRTPEEIIAIAEQKFQAEKLAFEAEKLAIEEAHKKEILEAQTQVKLQEKLAEIEAKRMKLYKDSSKSKAHSDKLAQLRSDLSDMKARGVDYSKISKSKMSVGSTPPPPPQSPSEPADEQTKLILSGLWLGACFFLQRFFEKIFEDKGHSLLAVCALGFLIAFFTANYFLLGGSVTGGLMGAAGDRG